MWEAGSIQPTAQSQGAGGRLIAARNRISASARLNGIRPVGAATDARRVGKLSCALNGGGFCLRFLASPGGVAERSESFKIMIAGGNHSKIKKLSDGTSEPAD